MSPQMIGEYEVAEKLGEGGMGTVYRANRGGLDAIALAHDDHALDRREESTYRLLEPSPNGPKHSQVRDGRCRMTEDPPMATEAYRQRSGRMDSSDSGLVLPKNEDVSDGEFAGTRNWGSFGRAWPAWRRGGNSCLLQKVDMRRILFASVLTVLLAAVGANAGTLKQVRLAEYGHNARNTIHSPIFRAGSAPLTVGKFTSAKDFNTKIVRGLGNLFTKGPTYDLDRKVNVADLVAESLRAEAKAMALSFVAPDGTEPWDITGDLRNTYIECWQITGWGAILFYGYMDVALQIRRPDGTSLQQRFRVHTFSETPGAASFGRGGKAEVAIATMLVEGAQEILARLNHDVLKAEPAPQIQSVLQRLGLEGASGHENELRFVGLSGGPAAAATLLKLLRTEEDDDIRYLVIDAIACTGSLDARVALIDRYGGEDESGRWYSIKALDYIGGENASSFITDKGPRDAADSVKRLAARILGG